MIKELYPFQWQGVKFLIDRGNPYRVNDYPKPRAMLCDEPGLGKTIQACTAARYGYTALIDEVDELGNINKVEKAFCHYPLVMCPRVLVPMWQTELENAGVMRYVVVYYEQLLQPQYFTWLLAGAEKKVFTVFIADEAHLLKEPKTQRVKRVKEIIQFINVRWLLTGTPVVNRLTDLLSLLELLNLVQPLFTNKTNFIKDHAFNPVTRRNDGQRNIDVLNNKMRPYLICRKTEEVLPDLPPLRYTTEVVDTGLTDENYWIAKRPHENEHQYITRIQEGVCMEKCAIAIDWISVWLEGSAPDKKIVIFAHNIAVQDKILEFFKQSHKAAAVKAAYSTEKRVAEIKRFQEDSECRIIVLSLLCGGVGITLHASDTVLFVQFPWTPALYHQACKRIHRIGQTSAMCWVINLVLKGTVDYRQVEVLCQKQELVDAFTETDMAKILFDRDKMGIQHEAEVAL
jgi:SWI/SNF-related matrix-associated actin-dependent regulator 1 of chromatin subfamily A